MREVQRRMLAVPGVTGVHDLHVWTVVNGVVAMSGHAIVPHLEAHPGVLDGIRNELSELGIAHVTIQLEVSDECEEAPEVAPAAGDGSFHHGHRHG
jgi:cobalt-zinc-cadmium efflux system protein